MLAILAIGIITRTPDLVCNSTTRTNPYLGRIRLQGNADCSLIYNRNKLNCWLKHWLKYCIWWCHFLPRWKQLQRFKANFWYSSINININAFRPGYEVQVIHVSFEIKGVPQGSDWDSALFIFFKLSLATFSIKYMIHSTIIFTNLLMGKWINWVANKI